MFIILNIVKIKPQSFIKKNKFGVTELLLDTTSLINQNKF